MNEKIVLEGYQYINSQKELDIYHSQMLNEIYYSLKSDLYNGEVGSFITNVKVVKEAYDKQLKNIHKNNKETIQLLVFIDGESVSEHFYQDIDNAYFIYVYKNQYLNIDKLVNSNCIVEYYQVDSESTLSNSGVITYLISKMIKDYTIKAIGFITNDYLFHGLLPAIKNYYNIPIYINKETSLNKIVTKLVKQFNNKNSWPTSESDLYNHIKNNFSYVHKPEEVIDYMYNNGYFYQNGKNIVYTSII